MLPRHQNCQGFHFISFSLLGGKMDLYLKLLSDPDFRWHWKVPEWQPGQLKSSISIQNRCSTGSVSFPTLVSTNLAHPWSQVREEFIFHNHSELSPLVKMTSEGRQLVPVVVVVFVSWMDTWPTEIWLKTNIHTTAGQKILGEQFIHWKNVFVVNPQPFVNLTQNYQIVFLGEKDFSRLRCHSQNGQRMRW